MVKVMHLLGHIFQKAGKTSFTKIDHQSEAECEIGTADQSEDDLNKPKSQNALRKRLLVGLAISTVVLFMVLVITMCGYIISTVIRLSYNCQNDTQSIDGLKCNFNQEATELQLAMEQVTSLASGAMVLVHPVSQEVKYREQVIVHCLFSQPVKCEWTRRGDTVDISGRYEYAVPRMDDGNSDCSITVQSFRQLDVGEWRCFGVFDDQSSIATSTAMLTLP